jgi:hypothetical protein
LAIDYKYEIFLNGPDSLIITQIKRVFRVRKLIYIVRDVQNSLVLHIYKSVYYLDFWNVT